MQEPDRVPVFFYIASCARILHMDIDRNIQQVALDNYLWGSSADDVTVGAALDADGGVLHVRFSVSERELRRMVWEPNGKVWTDSCVEVFVKNTDSDEYSNFEFSATGAFLAAHGAGRRDRVRYSNQEREAVAVEVRILQNDNRRSRWVLDASIDLVRIGIIPSAPHEIAFNLYKCGDGLQRPHFLSLFDIPLESPDFHRPEFFHKAVIH